ncbi:MAG TPA: carboxypeptidase-like regulatory domain-containing protein [Polyangiaceae bacterium]|jgi:hypothetical protein|nr:carboxypeptidase-like regulatory domain-containing protein [Polyangiaceae bacterium]
MGAFRIVFAIVVGSSSVLGCKTDPIHPASSDGATALADAAPKPGPVNALPIPKDLVEKTVNPNKLPEYKGATGVVEGTVYVTGDPAPPTMGKNFDRCPAAADVYGKTFREGPPLPNGSRVLADAVLGVTGYSGFIVAEKQPAKRISIHNCAFSQRTVDMTFGQALEVKNDGGQGPLFAPDFENQMAPAVMIATPGGDPVKLYPKQPGRYRLVDRVGNAWLDADVFVTVTPLHTTSDVKGHYRIEGVPVGNLHLNAWHPAIAHAWDKEIEVKDGVVTTVDVSIVNDKPAKQPPPANLKPVLP